MEVMFIWSDAVCSSVDICQHFTGPYLPTYMA